MKKLAAFAVWSIAGVALAGGVAGGGSGAGLTIGNETIELSKVEGEEGVYSLEKAKMMDVFAGYVARSPMKLDDDKVKADQYDFDKGQLLLRSLTDAKRVVIIKVREVQKTPETEENEQDQALDTAE